MQNIYMIATITLFLLGAGIIDAHPVAGLALISLMVVPIKLGQLDKKRLTCEEVERNARG